jgi:hypothetical protein
MQIPRDGAWATGPDLVSCLANQERICKNGNGGGRTKSRTFASSKFS